MKKDVNLLARQIVEQLLSEEEYKRMQKVLDKNDNVKKSDISGLKDPDKLVMVFATLNSQVSNGGFQQWIDNGYKEETIFELQDYISKYSAKYPVLHKLDKMLDAVDKALEDYYGEVGSPEELDAEVQRALDSHGGPDIATIDRLLGGTDLFSRDGSILSYAKNLVTIDTEEENGKWRTEIHLDDNGETLFTSELCDDEEEADAEAEQFIEIEIEDNAGWIIDPLTNDVQELVQGVHDNFDSALDKVDSQYYAISNEVLAAIEDIIATEYSWTAQLKKTLADGWKKAVSSTKSMIRNTLTKAANVFAEKPATK